MSLQQLRYLLALDDCRHFGRAAAHCFVAQPTLTTQFKKLEEELGVSLIDRAASPLRPTVIGEKVIAHARLILDDVEGLKSMLAEENETLAGTYTLGIIPTLAPYLLPLFIKPFATRFPEAQLIVKEMTSEQIIDGLKRKTIDMGLLATPLEEKQLREIVLFYEPFLIYAAEEESILQQHPLLPEHVEQKDLWLLEQGHCFRNQVLNICGATSTLDAPGIVAKAGNRPFTFQAGSIETLKNLVRSNLGYTIVPEMSVGPVDAVHTKRFADPQPAREVSLVVGKYFIRERLIEEMRRVILEVVPENFVKNERFFSVAWRG